LTCPSSGKKYRASYVATKHVRSSAQTKSAEEAGAEKTESAAAGTHPAPTAQKVALPGVS